MTDIDARIAQWEKMTEADPDNSMGWFSLGNACREAERMEPAAAALEKAIELDPSLSRAYQLLAQVLIATDSFQRAGEILTKGYTIAAEQGDVMPQRAMESLLKKLGLPVPQVAKPEPTYDPADLGDNAIVDRRTGKVGPRLPDPPMRGPVGQFIYDHFSMTTWQEWIGMGTKVINEMRLDFSHLEHQKTYEDQMLDWLGVSREEIDQYAKQQIQEN